MSLLSGPSVPIPKVSYALRKKEGKKKGKLSGGLQGGSVLLIRLLLRSHYHLLGGKGGGNTKTDGQMYSRERWGIYSRICSDKDGEIRGKLGWHSVDKHDLKCMEKKRATPHCFSTIYIHYVYYFVLISSWNETNLGYDYCSTMNNYTSFI